MPDPEIQAAVQDYFEKLGGWEREAGKLAAQATKLVLEVEKRLELENSKIQITKKDVLDQLKKPSPTMQFRLLQPQPQHYQDPLTPVNNAIKILEYQKTHEMFMQVHHLNAEQARIATLFRLTPGNPGASNPHEVAAVVQYLSNFDGEKGKEKDLANPEVVKRHLNSLLDPNAGPQVYQKALDSMGGMTNDPNAVAAAAKEAAEKATAEARKREEEQAQKRKEEEEKAKAKEKLEQEAQRRLSTTPAPTPPPPH